MGYRYERIVGESGQLQERLDQELGERRHYEAQVKQLHRQHKRHDAMVADLNKQVTHYLGHFRNNNLLNDRRYVIHSSVL